MKDLLECVQIGTHMQNVKDGVCVFCGCERVRDYAISTSDGHDEDWTYYDSEKDAYDTFIYMQSWETDIHLYKFSVEFGYEVIDSWCDDDDVI